MSNVLIEQKEFFDFIVSEIKNNRVSHSYLIETSGYNNCDFVIKEFLKMLLCKEKRNNGECNCKLCKLIEEEKYPDIKYIEPDGSFIKKEQLINVKEDLKNKSVYDNKRIYVIKDATKLNNSSANTMLKFLEEPEPDIIAVLVADSRYRVIDTIVSRCQIISLSREFDNCNSDDVILLTDLLCLEGKGFLKYEEILHLLPDRTEASIYLKKVQQFLFSQIGNNYLNLSDSKLIDIVSIIEKTLEKLEYNVNYKLVLDNLLASIMEVVIG